MELDRQAAGMEEVNPEKYRKGMRRLAAAVNIISTDMNGKLHGLLATAVCSVSADPPMLLVCVNQDAAACAPIGDSGRFCVSVLGQKQYALTQKFLSVKSEERLNMCKWQRLATGAPAIDNALVSFDCEVAQVIHAGTHTIYIGRVVAVALPEADAPLLYFDGGYGGIVPTVLK